MMADLFDTLGDVWGTIVLALRVARSRCHICRTPAATRFRSRHGPICDHCQTMLWHRVIGAKARDA